MPRHSIKSRNKPTSDYDNSSDTDSRLDHHRRRVDEKVKKLPKSYKQHGRGDRTVPDLRDRLNRSGISIQESTLSSDKKANKDDVELEWEETTRRKKKIRPSKKTVVQRKDLGKKTRTVARVTSSSSSDEEEDEENDDVDDDSDDNDDVHHKYSKHSKPNRIVVDNTKQNRSQKPVSRHHGKPSSQSVRKYETLSERFRDIQSAVVIPTSRRLVEDEHVVSVMRSALREPKSGSDSDDDKLTVRKQSGNSKKRTKSSGGRHVDVVHPKRSKEDHVEDGAHHRSPGSAAHDRGSRDHGRRRSPHQERGSRDRKRDRPDDQGKVVNPEDINRRLQRKVRTPTPPVKFPEPSARQEERFLTDWQVDPALVPKGGSYFIHDDRAPVRRRGGFRGPQGGEAGRLSPTRWKHDMYGKEPPVETQDPRVRLPRAPVKDRLGPRDEPNPGFNEHTQASEDPRILPDFSARLDRPRTYTGRNGSHDDRLYTRNNDYWHDEDRQRYRGKRPRYPYEAPRFSGVGRRMPDGPYSDSRQYSRSRRGR